MAEMRNITELDLELAGLFYPILIELAKNDAPLTYSGLKARAKHEHPGHGASVDRCADQAVGRRLEVIRRFTSSKDYPDVSARPCQRDVAGASAGC